MSNVPAFLSGLPDAQVGANYTHSERPLKTIRKIVVKGSVDVYFRRFNTPQLVVAGETQEAVDAIKTYFKGDELIIENEGTSIQCGGFSFGNISIGGAGGGVHINVNGQNIHTNGNANQGKHDKLIRSPSMHRNVIVWYLKAAGFTTATIASHLSISPSRVNALALRPRKQLYTGISIELMQWSGKVENLSSEVLFSAANHDMNRW